MNSGPFKSLAQTLKVCYLVSIEKCKELAPEKEHVTSIREKVCWNDYLCME